MNRVTVRLLRDGSRKVCIHWFRRTPDGPIETRGKATLTPRGPIKLGGAKGQIACRQSQTQVLSSLPGGRFERTVYSDDVRAVTCPECKAHPLFQKALDAMADLLPGSDSPVGSQEM